MELPLEAILKEMREIIGNQAQEIAVLKATIDAKFTETTPSKP